MNNSKNRHNIIICTLLLTLLSSQSKAFSQSTYTSSADLSQARSSLLSHMDALNKQYSDLSKNYDSYRELAGQTKKQMDQIENAIKQDDEALRRIEDALRNSP